MNERKKKRMKEGTTGKQNEYLVVESTDLIHWSSEHNEIPRMKETMNRFLIRMKEETE